MPSIRIRIGASTDSSVATAFSSLEKAAARSAAVIKKELGNAMGVLSKGGNSGGLAKVAAENKKAADDTAKAMGALALGAAAKFKQLQKGLKGIPADLKMVAQEAQKALQSMEREKARAALGIGSNKNSLYWHPTSFLAVRKPTIETIRMNPGQAIANFGMGAVGFAKRAALGMAHSMGIETDIGSIVKKNMNEENEAQKLVNAGFIANHGAAGVRVDRRDILNETRETAINTGMERGDIIGGLRTFVGKTGDLALGRSLMNDLAKLSKATGSSFEDMADASAEVSNHLGDVANKGDVTVSIMRAVAGQGKLGAIEVRDLAKQMAKIAATANMFTGGAKENIGVLGVLAQESKLEGGSASSGQAATSVARFASGLTTKSTIKAWQKFGLKDAAFSDSTHTSLMSPMEIIKTALRVTSGGGTGKGQSDLGEFAKLVPNAMSMRAFRGFATIYNQHGGGKEGMAAVDNEFERLSSALLTEAEVNKEFSDSMTTADSKVKVLNEKWAKASEQLAGPAAQALDILVKASDGAATALGQLSKDFNQNGIGGLVDDMEEGLKEMVGLGTTPAAAGSTKAEEDALDPTKQKTREDRLKALEKSLGNNEGMGAGGLWHPDAAAAVSGLKNTALPPGFDYSSMGLLSPEALSKNGSGLIKKSFIDQVSQDTAAQGSKVDIEKKMLAEMEEKADTLRRSGTLGKDVQGDLHKQGVSNADIQAMKDKLAGDERFRDRQLSILEAIRIALESGRLGLNNDTAAPSTAPGVPSPGPTPGVPPVSDGAENSSHA